MLDNFFQLLQRFAKMVVDLLPSSPFRGFINNFQAPDYLGWVNWFFPVGTCLTILSAWLTAISLFYFYSILARWVKIIGD